MERFFWAGDSMSGLCDIYRFEAGGQHIRRLRGWGGPERHFEAGRVGSDRHGRVPATHARPTDPNGELYMQYSLSIASQLSTNHTNNDGILYRSAL